MKEVHEGRLDLRQATAMASVVDIYRYSSSFRDLRDPDRLKGRCGRCEFREVCGGSRARAYALTCDYLAEDPSCIYQPEGESHVPDRRRD